jgi:hypothetical protein
MLFIVGAALGLVYTWIKMIWSGGIN